MHNTSSTLLGMFRYLGTARRRFSSAPHRVLVVGSGPSGFYSAKYLLKDDPQVHVDVIDALPSPYGS